MDEVPTSIQSSLAKDELPKSAEALVKLFSKTFREDPKKAIADLYDWAAVRPSDQRWKFRNQLVVLTDRDLAYDDEYEGITPVDEEEWFRKEGSNKENGFDTQLDWTLTHEFTFGLSETGSGSFTSHPILYIGRRGGVYRLCPYH